jgi:type VI secretion system secreted protein Hcp
MKLTKTFRRVALGSMLGTAAISVSQQALAAFTAFISVKGKKQGQFKGEGADVKRRDKWMPVLSFQYGIKAPRDAASGLPNGKRQYDQLCFTKEWGPSDPQFMSAATANETLGEVNFEFVKTNATGEQFVFQTVKLTDATVASVRRYVGHAGEAVGTARHTAADAQALEDVCFTFRKIELEDKEGKTVTVDDWQSAI